MNRDGEPKASHKQGHGRVERGQVQGDRRVRAHRIVEKPQERNTHAAHHHICEATERRYCFSPSQDQALSEAGPWPREATASQQRGSTR